MRKIKFAIYYHAMAKNRQHRGIMAHLIHLDTANSGHIVQLKGSVLQVGRKEDNHVHLPDRTVSRYHAEFHFDEKNQFWMIKNLSSTNPVFINAQPVKHNSMLFDEDIVEIGIYKLQFMQN